MCQCGKEMEKRFGFEHRKNAYCEDCYMDLLSPSKACNPWAVHSAKTFPKGEEKLSGELPSSLRLSIILKKKMRVLRKELCRILVLQKKNLRGNSPY